ncbi:unnamed protein product, partial [Polarella glacialis]
AREADEQGGAEGAPDEAASILLRRRVPTVPQAELDGCSDWGLFSRQCVSSSSTSKDFTYDCNGSQVSLRKPGGGEYLFGDLARKLSASEEALAMWVLKSRRRFKKRSRILELGSGLGLAGLVAAACTSAKYVELTDGDPAVVDLLNDSISLNGDSFASKVAAQRLVWGEAPERAKTFDWIIAADALSLEACHSAILKTVRRLLKPSGTAIFLAPSSGTTTGPLEAFATAASALFDKIEVTRDYDQDVSDAFHGMRCFPKMVRLQRSAVSKPKLQKAPARQEVDGCARQSRPTSRQSSNTPRQMGPSSSQEATQLAGKEQQDPKAVAASDGRIGTEVEPASRPSSCEQELRLQERRSKVALLKRKMLAERWRQRENSKAAMDQASEPPALQGAATLPSLLSSADSDGQATPSLSSTTTPSVAHFVGLMLNMDVDLPTATQPGGYPESRSRRRPPPGPQAPQAPAGAALPARPPLSRGQEVGLSTDELLLGPVVVGLGAQLVHRRANSLPPAQQALGRRHWP